MSVSLKLVIALCALVLAPAHAVELVLDSVIGTTSSGEQKLRVNSRARFNFDPAAGILISSGTWVAEYLLPNQATRFAHQIEDFRASGDGKFSVRSYQCLEGTLGSQFLSANLCANYRFGPNNVDEGGMVDDVVLGPPRSLEGYRLTNFAWDGKALVVELSADPAGSSELFQESSLNLRLVTKPGR